MCHLPFFFVRALAHPRSTLTYTPFPYTTRFRPNPATAGLALVTQRQGNDRIGGTGASAHHALWIAGPGTATVPAALGQRPGVHQPRLHAPREELRPEPGIHHAALPAATRSEEHTSGLQSLMPTSYDVICLNKKK